MKRTLELVSFVSFVSFTMLIILTDITPAKNSINKSAHKPSAKPVFSVNKMALLKTPIKSYQ